MASASTASKNQALAMMMPTASCHEVKGSRSIRAAISRSRCDASMDWAVPLIVLPPTCAACRRRSFFVLSQMQREIHRDQRAARQGGNPDHAARRQAAGGKEAGISGIDPLFEARQIDHGKPHRDHLVER